MRQAAAGNFDEELRCHTQRATSDLRYAIRSAQRAMRDVSDTVSSQGQDWCAYVFVY
jgi:hypothetical protein